MTGNVRPENMERINTPALAQAFIDEQIKDALKTLRKIVAETKEAEEVK